MLYDPRRLAARRHAKAEAFELAIEQRVSVDDNQQSLYAILDAALPKGARIALTGKDPHGELIQARFVTE